VRAQLRPAGHQPESQALTGRTHRGDVLEGPLPEALRRTSGLLKSLRDFLPEERQTGQSGSSGTGISAATSRIEGAGLAVLPLRAAQTGRCLPNS
jgi:hypothetical protein